MGIHGIHAGGGYLLNHGKPHPGKGNAIADTPLAASSSEPPVSSSEPPVSSTDPAGESGAQTDVPTDVSSSKGVVRNLLAGHYKGVADVRLRINFADELQAIEQKSVQNTLGEYDATLESFGQDVDALLGFGEELTPEQEAAAQAVADGNSELLASDGSSTGDILSLIDQLEEDFQTLVELLTPPPSENPPPPENPLPEDPPLAIDPAEGSEDAADLAIVVNTYSLEATSDSLTSETTQVNLEIQDVGNLETEPGSEVDTEETPIVGTVDALDEEVPVDEGVDEEADSELDTFVTSFIETWSSALLDPLDALRSALGDLQSVSPLSDPPHGNGVAYDRFLAMLDQLNSSDIPPSESDDEEALDLTV